MPGTCTGGAGGKPLAPLTALPALALLTCTACKLGQSEPVGRTSKRGQDYDTPALGGLISGAWRACWLHLT